MNAPNLQTPRDWLELKKRLDEAEEELLDLEADPDKPLWWNRAYVIDIPLPLFINTAVFGTFTVDADHEFFVLGQEAFYSATGLVTETVDVSPVTSPATLVIPESLRPLIFDYTWMLHDSGTDRDWGNLPLPSSVFRNGNMHGLNYNGGQARLRGGTLVTATINPTFFDVNSTATGLSDFESHSLQIILSGIAVRKGAL